MGSGHNNFRPKTMDRAKDHSTPARDPRAGGCFAPQDGDPVSKRDVLKLGRRARFESGEKEGEGGDKDLLHPRIVVLLSDWCQIDL